MQLVRLPNVFTALADVLLGFLITHHGEGAYAELPWLLAASGCMYLAGMALNDVWDRDIDAIERPERPIPSGRVSLSTAKRVGWGLLVAGLALALLASALSGAARPMIVAAPLAALIVGYDAYLKRTPLGPLAMGGCRALNVLLGLSAAPLFAWHALHLAIAGGLGVYVAGLTWFARNEASESRRPQLALAALVMLIGMAALMEYPRWNDERLPIEFAPHYALNEPWRWNVLWLAIGALVGHRLLRAILAPHPSSVRLAVKSAILSIVVLDAICCLGVRGPLSAMAVLLMLPPAMWLGRWINST